jgi:hypothetical protein
MTSVVPLQKELTWALAPEGCSWGILENSNSPQPVYAQYLVPSTLYSPVALFSSALLHSDPEPAPTLKKGQSSAENLISLTSPKRTIVRSWDSLTRTQAAASERCSAIKLGPVRIQCCSPAIHPLLTDTVANLRSLGFSQRHGSNPMVIASRATTTG